MKIFGLIPAIVLGDGVVKHTAQKRLSDGSQKPILGGRVILNLFHNEGIALGALKNQKEKVSKVTMGILVFAAGMLAATPREAGTKARRTGLALMLGGGISNLIDRIYRGHVVDYFSLNFGPFREKLRRVVFNMSDLFILTGAVMACISTGTKKVNKDQSKKRLSSD